MSVKRQFLGWDTPCLVRAAEFLVERYRDDRFVDLTQVIAVLSGGRAGRRLLELLVDCAEARDLFLVPPEIVTVGKLPELLISTESPVASDLQRALLWIEALKSKKSERLLSLTPVVPTANGLSAWLALAEQFDKLYTELAGANHSFADVGRICREDPDCFTDERWDVLQDIFEDYLKRLLSLDMTDTHCARRRSVENQAIRTENDIFLISTVDLNLTLRMIIEQVSSQVTALIGAPEELSDRFDDYGCLIPDKWVDAQVELEDRQIQVVDGADDQAKAVAESIASLNGRFTADQITVGIGDTQLTPYIVRRMAQRNLPLREARGIEVNSTTPCKFLKAAASYLSGKLFTSFAALVRHPDVFCWMTEQLGSASDEEFLASLDKYHDNHLQAVLTRKLAGEGSLPILIKSLVITLDKLLGELDDSARHVSEWIAPIENTLAKLYCNHSFKKGSLEEHQGTEALKLIGQVLSQLGEVTCTLTESISSAEAISLILHVLAAKHIRPESQDEAIELLGWLELQLDDAPVLLVTSLNEGSIPTVVDSHPFLPNTLRGKLGLVDNHRRFARDIFALSSMTKSRKNLCLIAGRRSVNGDPIAPSRLLVACNEDKLVKRVRNFYQTTASVAPEAAAVMNETSPPPFFCLEKPLPLKLHGSCPSHGSYPSHGLYPSPITSLSATAFRDYLRCPYRFYLKHVLQLEHLDDSAEEMSGGLFGSLTHEVLQNFGASELKDSSNESEIFHYLKKALDDSSFRRFGKNVLPAVFVQLHQLRSRLKEFAIWQARWVASGWKITHIETDFAPEKSQLTLDNGRKVNLRARIDRLDFNERIGEWAIIDYKTAERQKPPEQSHRRRKKEWIDLQLPVYHYLVSKSGIVESNIPIRLGYLMLGSDRTKITDEWAYWSKEELEGAMTCILEVAANVDKEKFWPPSKRVSGYDEYDILCARGHYQMEESED